MRHAGFELSVGRIYKYTSVQSSLKDLISLSIFLFLERAILRLFLSSLRVYVCFYSLTDCNDLIG